MTSTTQKFGAAEVALRLRRDIEHGAYAPLERLPTQREMAQEFNIARGTLRAALNQLEREGILEIRPGSGTYVRPVPVVPAASVIENAAPLELIDARFALEPHICRLAVLNARRSDLARAEELLLEMERSVTNVGMFAKIDTDFHRLLAETTGNQLLIWIIGQISSVRNQAQWGQMRELTLNREIIYHYNQQHREIIGAIRGREAELAANKMKQHLETARLSLTRAFET